VADPELWNKESEKGCAPLPDFFILCKNWPRLMHFFVQNFRPRPTCFEMHLVNLGRAVESFAPSSFEFATANKSSGGTLFALQRGHSLHVTFRAFIKRRTCKLTGFIIRDVVSVETSRSRDGLEMY